MGRGVSRAGLPYGISLPCVGSWRRRQFLFHPVL